MEFPSLETLVNQTGTSWQSPLAPLLKQGKWAGIFCTYLSAKCYPELQVPVAFSCDIRLITFQFCVSKDASSCFEANATLIKPYLKPQDMYLQPLPKCKKN